MPHPPVPADTALAAALADTDQHCSDCGLCVAECRFLQRHGSPRQIARRLAHDPTLDRLAFECSLCGLCTAVCGDQVDPGALFLELRRAAVRAGRGEFPHHAGILAWEARGTSSRYSLIALPPGGRTVFFPGCSLSGSRAPVVKMVFALLRKQDARLGIVLDCCSKPSHDLGREALFKARFTELVSALRTRGVERILTACPNCHQVFSRYGEGLTVASVYAELAALPAPLPVAAASLHGVLHDPCGGRFAADVQRGTRALAARLGLQLAELPHTGPTTLCCGEGGTVRGLAPELAASWGERIALEAAGRSVVSACSGCVRQLGALTPASHLLDHLTDPARAAAGRPRATRAPWSYWQRLRLKRFFRGQLRGETPSQRPYRP